MAKTNIKATFDTLDGYFLNTGNMKLNKNYFLDSIYTEIDVTFRNDKQMREYIKNTRKITTIIWTAFISMTNDYLENEGYGKNILYMNFMIIMSLLVKMCIGLCQNNKLIMMSPLLI